MSINLLQKLRVEAADVLSAYRKIDFASSETTRWLPFLLPRQTKFVLQKYIPASETFPLQVFFELTSEGKVSKDASLDVTYIC